MSLFSGRAAHQADDETIQLKEQIKLLQSRLTSKTEALVRVGKDLDAVEEERKSWKAEAATYERNLAGVENELSKAKEASNRLRHGHAEEKMEMETRLNRADRQLKALDAENAQLRADMRESQKDCRIYRQKLAKLEIAKMESEEVLEELPAAKIRTATRESKEDGKLDKYEKLLHEHKLLEADFQQVLTSKEEAVVERDTLLKKIDRLQKELGYVLNGDNRRVAEDLDEILAENRFLKAQLDTAQEESDSMKVNLEKYRVVAEESEKKKMPVGKKKDEAKRERLPSDNTPLEDKSSVAVINMKQIREMITSQSISLDESDYRTISNILLDLCNDKQMALAHQRKANKILGSRLSEVEGKLAKMELGRSPCSISPQSSPFYLGSSPRNTAAPSFLNLGDQVVSSDISNVAEFSSTEE